MKLFSVLVLTLISFNGYINCVDFKDCGSDDGKVDSIVISDCSESDSYCTFKTGTNPSIDVKFTPSVDSKSATIKLWGIIAGSAVPFKVNPDDACDKWGVKCPLSKGTSNEVKVTLPVSASYPKINFVVRVALVDDSGKDLFCKEFPAKIE